MNKISSIETAVLGMLFDGAMHGYEIGKAIEWQSMREWTDIAFSSIYYVLKRLEKKALVKGRVELSKKNVARKVYSITSVGRKVLHAKIESITSKYETLKWRMDLGMAYLNVLSKDEAKQSLKKYRESLVELIKGYKALEKFLIDEKCPVNRLALARRPLAHIKTEKEWVESYIKQLK